MEREDLINNVKNSIQGKDVGWKEFENWFITTSERMFGVDVGFLKIDCYAIVVEESHVGLLLNKADEERKKIMFPISILNKFSVVWLGR